MEDETSVKITIDPNGNKVKEYQCGKLKIKAVYTNKPSEEALKTANRTYNKYYDVFNK